MYHSKWMGRECTLFLELERGAEWKMLQTPVLPDSQLHCKQQTPLLQSQPATRAIANALCAEADAPEVWMSSNQSLRAWNVMSLGQSYSWFYLLYLRKVLVQPTARSFPKQTITALDCPGVVSEPCNGFYFCMYIFTYISKNLHN